MSGQNLIKVEHWLQNIVENLCSAQLCFMQLPGRAQLISYTGQNDLIQTKPVGVEQWDGCGKRQRRCTEKPHLKLRLLLLQVFFSEAVFPPFVCLDA